MSRDPRYRIRYEVPPYEPDPWYWTVFSILLELLVLISLILGVPFILWLLAGGA